jgi:ABC-type siderophore export system fused ATPase/permease subunit
LILVRDPIGCKSVKQKPVQGKTPMKKLLAFAWLNVVLFSIFGCLFYCVANTPSPTEALNAAVIATALVFGAVYGIIAVGVLTVMAWKTLMAPSPAFARKSQSVA